MAHNNAATLQMFAFNLRKPKFQDRRVRQAIALAFNFDWANDKLFYNQYQRIYSYFTNTGMEAGGLPQGKELSILKNIGISCLKKFLPLFQPIRGMAILKKRVGI